MPASNNVKKTTVDVPEWVISGGKYFGPAFLAVAIGYGQIIAARADIDDLKRIDQSIETKIETHRELLSQLNNRQSTVELKQSVQEKVIAESLVRIETSLKDVQLDVKELQKLRMQSP